MIDLALWEPYLEAFTRMLHASGDPVAAQRHRRDMTAYIEVSPDFWSLRNDSYDHPRRERTGWYKQGTRPPDARARRRRS